MPRKRNRTSEKKTEEIEDYDFLFDDTQSSSGRSSHEPQHRNAANARERARMRVLSKAFCRLKTTLPWVPADTKLSKLDTLRLAASYIAHLRALLHEPRSAHTPPHPLSLAWPFAFQHGSSLSCAISQRWSINSQDDNTHQIHRQNVTKEAHSNNYMPDYDESGYEDRNFEEINENTKMQYCNYSYKENYYDNMRSYSDVTNNL
ncbi:uncharacterized protein LOC126970336 [Leptidea sinapis]|uniref:uncharacterized protein LOC126970336 n=1 Tax=Leptidea sinapis TaxID=189913 RepID=UPI0021C3A547|nr:uncharacterized protein LOC126970336 [Leptidea sinapis]